MPDGEISIMEALNQIQSWLNAGAYEKVIQGCQEILSIEPGNQRALSLLKQAEAARHNEEQAAQESAVDPLQNLEVAEEEAKSSNEPMSTEPHAQPVEEDSKEEEYEYYRAPRPSKKKMFLAMLIPAVIVVVVGGGIVSFMNNQNREDLLEDAENGTGKPEVNDHANDETPDTSYLAENEQRVTDLTTMADAIEEYWADNARYPSVEEVEALIEKELGEVPMDPRQGDVDASGDAYGYVYALYDFNGVKGGAYVLSALFQDSKGEAHAWAQGASTKNYDDFREVGADHVTFIGAPLIK